MHLSPLDLLTLYDSDQDVIRCLIRRPQLTAAEISKMTQIPLGELNDVLSRLLKKARVRETSKNGSPTFAVQYETPKRQSKASTSLLDSLFG